MGRDEHRSKKNNRLAQTPKQQLKNTTENDFEVEFSQELSRAGDRNTQHRVKAIKKEQKRQ